MDSRILAAPGVRTLARPGWRGTFATAVGLVIAQPALWLLGILGFCVRGGILLLVAPMIVLPTPVEARLLLGGYLGSTGFSPGFYSLFAIVAAVAAFLTVGVLLLLARIELSSFERVFGSPAAAELAGVGDLPEPRSGRRMLLMRLFGVQVVTFVALMIAAAPVASAVGQVAFFEVTRPTGSAPIYDRVLSAVGEQLFFFAICVLVIEMLSALSSRELLARAFDWRESAPSRGRSWLLPALARATVRPFRSPLRTFGTALISWLATAAVLVPALWVLSLAWSAVRSTFLSAVSFSDLGEDLGMLLVAFGLSFVFVIGLALGGFASALRAALWSVDRLR